AVQANAGARIEDRGSLVMDEVTGDNFVFRVAENSLHWAFCGFLHLLADLLVRRFLLGLHREVNHRDGWGWHTERHARELALDRRKNQTHCLCGACGGRNDVDGGGAATLPVLA